MGKQQQQKNQVVHKQIHHKKYQGNNLRRQNNNNKPKPIIHNTIINISSKTQTKLDSRPVSKQSSKTVMDNLMNDSGKNTPQKKKNNVR